MDLETLFAIASRIALAGWVVLLFYRWKPIPVTIISALTIPLILSIGYTGMLVSSFGSESQGGFDTLANVALLFENKGALLAGWVHYLAFDLLVGFWIMKRGTEENMPYWLVLPCLPLTLMFGPVGFLLFQIIRFVRSRMNSDQKFLTGFH